ncbi:uncharacterized protein EV422DRAFT_566672 [Fimicolochytrium jonesii]|uniref:uncharacterized protein n=1 Tax=Fimicolochytrium jonesii TaxID=1396493 RepID=UPI0022FE693E|nr:uncharacterized protein EV422DRAFT_566672 [Fimicolochytrium jonesii]KAI8822239.1 hypothetical protein EV422DRAFT_566672 [Fimicolochytrium jonesii]
MGYYCDYNGYCYTTRPNYTLIFVGVGVSLFLSLLCCYIRQRNNNGAPAGTIVAPGGTVTGPPVYVAQGAPYPPEGGNNNYMYPLPEYQPPMYPPPAAGVTDPTYQPKMGDNNTTVVQMTDPWSPPTPPVLAAGPQHQHMHAPHNPHTQHHTPY